MYINTVTPSMLTLQAQRTAISLYGADYIKYGVSIEGGRIIQNFRKIRPFFTLKGEFFDRWNAVWGTPDKPFELWGADIDNFATFYNMGLNINQIFSFTSVQTPNYFRFESLDSTIRDVCNLDEKHTGIVRNAIAELLNKSTGKIYNHTDAYFGLKYNHWDNIFKPLMRRHYKSYDIFCTIEEQIIVPYWDARTAEETAKRENMIKNIGLIIAGTAIAIITAGVSTQTVAKAATDILNTTTNINISPDIIKSGLDSIAGISAPSGNILENIGKGTTDLLEKARSAIGNIDLDPTHVNLGPIDLDPTHINLNLPEISYDDVIKNGNEILKNTPRIPENSSNIKIVENNNSEIKPEKFVFPIAALIAGITLILGR